MTVGYVHITGTMGDGVRVQAIRRFFEQNGIAHRDLPIVIGPVQGNLIRELLSPFGWPMAARKLIWDRSYPLLKEANWRLLVRNWDESVAGHVRALIPLTEGVDLFQGEGLVDGLVAASLARHFRKPYVFDMHGLHVEEARLTGSSEYVNACTRWERALVEGARTTVVVTPAMQDYVCERYGLDRDRVVICPNGTELRDVQAHYQEPLHVIYAGNFAPFENVQAFLETAEVMTGAGDDVRFVLMGDGVLRNEIFDYISQRGVDVVYLGKKPQGRVFPVLGRMQVGFLGQIGGTALTGSPIKLLDYASCGLPVVAGPGAWEEPVRKFGAGIIVKDTAPESFAEGIRRMRNREAWETMSAGAKEMILRGSFLWAETLRPFLDVYAHSR